MIPIVRLYPSEEQAYAAAQALAERRFPEDKILIIRPSAAAGDEAGVVRSAVDEGLLPGSHVRICTQALQQGRSVVAID